MHILEPIKHSFLKVESCLIKAEGGKTTCFMQWRNCSFPLLSILSLYPFMHDLKKERKKRPMSHIKLKSGVRWNNNQALECSLAEVFLQNQRKQHNSNVSVTLAWRSDTGIMCLIRLQRYHFRLQVIHYLSKPSAKMPAHIVTKLHVLMPGAFNAPYEEINQLKNKSMKRELEHKNAPIQKASSRLKHCKSIKYPVWGISDSDYRNASCSVVCPLFIILDTIAMAKLSLYHKIMFLVSAIKVTPKVLQWLQSCLEDHVLRLEIDGGFSRIICTELDCTWHKDEHLWSENPTSLKWHQ